MPSYFRVFLDLIYPHRCQNCSKLTNSLVCPECTAALPTISDQICLYCGKPTALTVPGCRECRGRKLYFDSARSVWAYENLARNIIHDFKYKNQKSLAVGLAGALAPLIKADGLITWVPMTLKKQFIRGYNQSKLLALCLADLVDGDAAALLRRVRRARDQNLLSFAERRQNVKDAFSLVRAPKTGRERVFLIDDVYTSGATVAECSRVLKDGGFSVVHVLTLARTPHR